MNYLKKSRTTRASLTFVTAFVVMNLPGCGGGMVGTGTGPSPETYQLENLPKRISPDIPKTLLKGEEITPPVHENSNVIEEKSTFSSRMNDINSRKSEGWQRINEQLLEVSLTRVNAEINSTIIDIAFDDIRNRCIDQLIACIIPSDQLRVKLTQFVINRFIELAIDWVERIPPARLDKLGREEAAALITEQFTSLLDSEVVLGETHYSQLDGAPYDHSVRTFLMREAASNEEFSVLLWKDEEFTARWHNDGNIAKFLFSVDLFNREYFYENNTPSELVIANKVFKNDDGQQVGDIHTKLVANNPSNAGVLVEVARVRTVPVVVDSKPSLNLHHGFVQGQMDNDGGYSMFDGVSFNIADTSRVWGYTGLRESFDFIGNLISGTQCSVRDFTQGVKVCDEEDFVPTGSIVSSITDSPYYFQPGEFDSLFSLQDAIRWNVDELPAEIKRIAVVSADSAIELSERELLCRGFQFVANDTRIFCGATDEQLANTIVLELVDGKPERILPEVNLVQDQ